MIRTAIFCYVLLFSIGATKGAITDTVSVSSPGGAIVFKLFQQHKQLQFSIAFAGRNIIEPSSILMMVDAVPVNSNLTITKVDRFKLNEIYPWWGAHSTAVNKFNAARISFKSNSAANNNTLVIEIKVFDDGAAYRQIITNKKTSSVPTEQTVFNLPKASTVWYHDLNMHYESVHVKKQVEDVQEGEWLAPPATFRSAQGIYASITEAAILNYSGMALQSNGRNGLVIRLANEQPTSYPYRLRYSPEDTARLMKPAAITGTITTPWRAVIIGRDLNALVNNDVVHNLNAAPDPTLFPQGINTSWLKPGRAVWKYLDGGGEGTPEVMKHFTDGAAALRFEHNILEGFWRRWTDEQLKDLVDYSRKKNVGIWLWEHSKRLRNPATRDSFFRKCNAFGIAGAKIDFFDHEAKEVMDLYESILNESAKYHVMVDFHGANKPTGLSRTYPNELTREAVKGMEASKLLDRATHETTIPFTRWLAGPAEYTVMHFGDRRKNTTWAHQIASAAILSAPLLTYAANPDTILANPAVEMIKSIPANWDETIVLPTSAIGEQAVFARRKDKTWFLAIMNGTTAKHISVPLQFLKKGQYQTSIVKDDPANTAAVILEQRKFSSTDTIELDLGAGGGYIARFSY